MSDRPNPRRVARTTARYVGELAYELPDPPDNPDFELLSESKQNEIEGRFLRGIELGKRKRREANAKRKRAWRARRDVQSGRVRFASTLGDVVRSHA